MNQTVGGTYLLCCGLQVFLRDFFTCQVGEDLSIGLPLSVRPVMGTALITLLLRFLSRSLVFWRLVLPTLLAQRLPSFAANL